MSTTTKSGGIFTFDHGQKKLHKAIGVQEEYLDDLGKQTSQILKDFLFDENKNIREDISPSILVEISAREFSYSQLVILASFYLQDKIDKFAEKIGNIEDSIKSISLDSKDIPSNIKEMLDRITEGKGKITAIDGDHLPKEFKDFLKRMSEEQENDRDDE